MRYFSTFSGIGGFEYGIQCAFDKQLAKIEQDRQGRNRTTNEVESDVLLTGWSAPLCVGYSEIDKYAIKGYERQFNGNIRRLQSNSYEIQQDSNNTTNKLQQRKLPDNNGGHKAYGDITKINADELPDFDCLVGGFPCQAFSIAGKRKGFDDTRGTLFFDLARILRAKQPRLFVFENVKGLLSHDDGNTFRTIIATIDELGYDCQWQVLNSKNHGVPQNRERIIIVGHLRGTSRPEVFPIGQCSQGFIESDKEQSSQTNIARTVDTRTGSYPKFGQYIAPVSCVNKGEKVRQNGRRFKTNNEPSFTLNTIDRQGVYDGMKIRRLTPVECERLQGFPDDWTALGIGEEPISDSQRYKMCGNAVTTNVIRDVFERIFASETN
jgi:DNA (cytosine-5)-methyltransferase 1